MTIPEPVPDAPPPKSKRGSRAAATPPETTAEAPAKPRRKRKTKAEKDAERAAEVARPVFAPQVWVLLGVVLLLVGVCVYLDPIGFAESGNTNNEPLIQTVIVLVMHVAGKNPVSIGLGILGLLALGWGVFGWLKERMSASKH